MTENTKEQAVSRKLPRHLECPADNLFSDIAEKTLPFFKKLRHTPNVLTGYALLFTVLSGLSLYADRFWPFALAYNLGYLFDCIDGMYARKYHMVTRFGDYFEHSRDILGNLALNVFVWYKFKPLPTWTWFAYSGLLLGTALHIGCQQKYYKRMQGESEQSESLDVLSKLCPRGLTLGWTRWFGPGTYTLGYTMLVGSFFPSK